MRYGALRAGRGRSRGVRAEHCRITRPLPEYDDDPEREHRPTPEEYAAGDREAHTPNAHTTRCRHEFTNYDELIQDLEPTNVWDRIRHAAIRERIHELIEQ